MSDHNRMIWLQSRSGAAALLLVLLTGLSLGYYGRLSLISPPTQTYRLDFGSAHWMQSAQPGNNVCFRKNLYLGETPRHAWVQITGVDGFSLFVNGHHAGVGGKALQDDPTIWGLFLGGNQSVICDISQFLVPGENTIALNVTRGSFPGNAKFICRGEITDSAGTTEFVSDKTWRVSNVPGTVPSLVTWISPTLDDSSWRHAVEASVERGNLNQPVPIPPILLQQPIKGQWIIDEKAEPGGNSTFLCRFDKINGARDAWLQIASDGAFSVILNGHYLGNFTDAVPSVKLINLRSWIRPKGNELLVQVQTPDSAPALIAEISFLSGQAKVGAINSDATWQLPNARNAATIGVYNYTGDRWGIPGKVGIPVALSAVEAMQQQINGWVFILISVSAVLLLWFWFGNFLARRRHEQSEQMLGVDATLHLPVLVATLALLLVRFDIRFRPDALINGGVFLALVAVLLLPRLLAIFWEGGVRPVQSLIAERREWSQWAKRHGFWIALGLIGLAGFIVRLRDLNTFPLDQDDILIRNYAQGILDRGFASLNFYGYVIPTTTYELLPYPIALSCLLFGWSDWAVLLPALTFGTATVVLVGLMARNLFDWRVGLCAALIHAFNPLNVFWSQHCFHPSQDQFFALLTIWSFYLAIREPGKLNVKYFYGAVLGFLFTYLSWEGVGFLLPIMAGTLMLMHPGRWTWLRQPHLWIGLAIVAAIVLVQLSLRKMVAPGFIFLGYGLAQLGGPQLYFLNPESMPFYYISSLLFTTPLLPLTLLAIIGVFYAWGNLSVRYCLVIFAALLAAFSLCMPVYSVRYFYFYEFLMPVIGCGVFFILWDQIRGLADGWKPALPIVWLSGVVLLLLVFGVTTETGLKVLRLAERPEPSLRYGVVRQDTKTPAEYVASHLRPGDIVLANLTQAFYLYGNRMPDYALNTLLATRMIYLNDFGGYRHRFVGIPMVRNLRDVNSIFGQGRRVWYIGGGPITVERSELKNALDFITQRSKVVFATYHTKVYLWDGVPTLAQQTVVNPALPPQPNLSPEKPDPEEIIGDDDEGSAVFSPHVSQSNLYPQWTRQNVLEPDPTRTNAAPTVQPLQPPRKPEKADSDE
ncbi:MAG: glycosyltransferase family 39 protein [Spartobacteria bacterium]